MSGLSSLIERVEAATGGDRELDLAIHLAFFPDGEIAGWMKYPRGISGREGYSWDIRGSSLIFEKWIADGRCTYNGGYPLPCYSTSLDAALTLLPGDVELDLKLRKDGTGYACAWTYHGNRSSNGQTLTLAALAAILRARQAADTEGQS